MTEPKEVIAGFQRLFQGRIDAYGSVEGKANKEPVTSLWSKWLDDHPEKRVYLAPKGRLRKANWIEVFREFIESTR